MSDDLVLDLLDREATSPVRELNLAAVRLKARHRRSRGRAVAVLSGLVLAAGVLGSDIPQRLGGAPTLTMEPVSGTGGSPEGAPTLKPAGFVRRDVTTGLPRFWRDGCPLRGVAWIRHEPPVGEPVLLPDPDNDGVPELPGPYSCSLDYTDADQAAANDEADRFDAAPFDVIYATLTANALDAPDSTPEIYTYEGVEYRRRGEAWVRIDATYPISEGDYLPAGPVSGRPLPEWTQADRDAAEAAGPPTQQHLDPAIVTHPSGPIPEPNPATGWDDLQRPFDQYDEVYLAGVEQQFTNWCTGSAPDADRRCRGPVTGESPWTPEDTRWIADVLDTLSDKWGADDPDGLWTNRMAHSAERLRDHADRGLDPLEDPSWRSLPPGDPYAYRGPSEGER